MPNTSELDQRQGRLAAKVALVIGGGTTGELPGTGAATARLFAAQGARVGVVGRRALHIAEDLATTSKSLAARWVIMCGGGGTSGSGC